MRIFDVIPDILSVLKASSRPQAPTEEELLAVAHAHLMETYGKALREVEMLHASVGDPVRAIFGTLKRPEVKGKWVYDVSLRLRAIYDLPDGSSRLRTPWLDCALRVFRDDEGRWVTT